MNKEATKAKMAPRERPLLSLAFSISYFLLGFHSPVDEWLEHQRPPTKQEAIVTPCLL
jgi:hypothetical protein